jgi:hypothetical protein
MTALLDRLDVRFLRRRSWARLARGLLSNINRPEE